jgi:hypothetical protein
MLRTTPSNIDWSRGRSSTSWPKLETPEGSRRARCRGRGVTGGVGMYLSGVID